MESVAMSYTQIYYHIIFSTKDRQKVLSANNRKELYNYIWGILKNKQCHVYRIGGTIDHIHILNKSTCNAKPIGNHQRLEDKYNHMD